MQPTQQRRNPKKLLLLLSLGVALAAAAFAGYIWLPGLMLTMATDAPEHSAKYYPRDTVVYGWVTLAPRHGQTDEARAIWDQLEEHRAFRQLTDDLRDEFQEKFGADFERDMKDWIGPELSYGVIDPPRGEDWGYEPMAATLGVRDREAAEDFLKDWTDHLEETSWPDFKRETYKGFQVWADQDREQMYLALSDDVLVLTFDQGNMEDIIDRIEGDAHRSLADSQHFQEARASFPKHRFASVYVDATAMLDHFGDADETAFLPDDDYIPGWVAASAGMFDRALVTQINVPEGYKGPLEVPDLQVPDHLMPRETPMFLAATFDPDLDHWRQVLREYDDLDDEQVELINELLMESAHDLGLDEPLQLRDSAGLEDIMDLALDFLEDTTGVDFEDDLIAHLSGTFALALHDLDVRELWEDPSGNAIPVVAMLSHRDDADEDLQETMEDIADLLEDRVDLKHMMVDLGGDTDAVVYRTGLEYQPSHMLHRGFLLLASTERALTQSARVGENLMDQLRSDREYQRVRSHLPEKSQFMFYLDLGSILGQLDSDDLGMEERNLRLLDSDDLGMEERNLRLLEDTLGRVAIGAYAPRCENQQDNGDPRCEFPGHSSTTVVLTLLEE